MYVYTYIHIYIYVWRRLFCILIGPKIQKIWIFLKKKILKNTPKTGFWPKTDLRIITGVFFYPPWTKFGGKSSTEHLIQAKSVILLEFLRIF